MEQQQTLPATLKQIGFLYVLGAPKIPRDLSKDAASQMISKLVDEQE